MTAAALGLTISFFAIGFGWAQIRRGERQSGRLAMALGTLGALLNLYAMFYAG